MGLRVVTSPGTVRKYFEEVVLAYEGYDCLVWPYAKFRSGYGKFFYRGSVNGAHRAVCEEVYGPPPSRTHQAAHSCGNGHLGCVAKNHLSWKTPVENNHDKIAHGTTNRGERQWRSILTENDVRAILKMRGEISNRQIARMFGVHDETVSQIYRGESWAWVESDDRRDTGNVSGHRRGEQCFQAKMTNAQVAEIKAKILSGARTSHLAEEYGVPMQTICGIKYGRKWRHVKPAELFGEAA